MEGKTPPPGQTAGELLEQSETFAGREFPDDPHPTSITLDRRPADRPQGTEGDLLVGPCPVRLIPDPDSPAYRVVVDGVAGTNASGVQITSAQFLALSALIEAFPGRLTNLELQDESGVADPAKAIREAMIREPALREVVMTPGQARRGLPGTYRIRQAPGLGVQSPPRE